MALVKSGTLGDALQWGEAFCQAANSESTVCSQETRDLTSCFRATYVGEIFCDGPVDDGGEGNSGVGEFAATAQCINCHRSKCVDVSSVAMKSAVAMGEEGKVVEAVGREGELGCGGR